MHDSTDRPDNQAQAVSPSYLRAYHRRRIAAASTAIHSAAVACLRQRLHPNTTPDACDIELTAAWTQHLGFTPWRGGQG